MCFRYVCLTLDCTCKFFSRRINSHDKIRRSMFRFLGFQSLLNCRFLLKTLSPKGCSFRSYESLASSIQPASPIPSHLKNNVAIFWNFNNKPSKNVLPFDVAIKLKAAASSFGRVRYTLVCSDLDALSYGPQVVNRGKNEAIAKPDGPHLCYVCGRKFYTNDRLFNHFKNVHEPEHRKRVNQIESAKGGRRVKLVGKYYMKMEKFKRAAMGLLSPKTGYHLIEDLRRVGFVTQVISNDTESVDLVLRNQMVEVMNRRHVGCFVIVSDDAGLVEVVLEAKQRCMRTVVVNDRVGGVLKRVADAVYSWKEVMTGKVKKEGPKILRRWKDRDILKRLEWTYDPESEKKFHTLDDQVCLEGGDGELPWWERNRKHQKKADGVWWKLDSEYRNSC